MDQYPQALLDDLMARVPVSTVVREYVRDLKKVGAEWEALSPWNAERTPSFKVNDAKGIFHDFSSGKGGNALKFIQEIDNCSFPVAVERLAKMAGVNLPGKNQRVNGSVNAIKARSATSDLAPSSRRKNGSADPPPRGKPSGTREIVETFPFTDPDGGLIYEEVRFQFRLPDGSWNEKSPGKPIKAVAQRRPCPGRPGVWIWGLAAGTYYRRSKEGDFYRATGKEPEDGSLETIDVDETGHALYALPELREELLQPSDERRLVFLPEGPRKAKALAAWGLLATSNSGGAKNWQSYHAQEFAGADVVILLDADEPGRKRGTTIAKSLEGIASRIRLLDFRDFWPGIPDKGDVVDWIERGGGTKERLLEIVEKLTEWAPAPFQSSYGAVWFHEVAAIKPKRDWLFKGLLQAGIFGVTYGAPGCGKSFLMTDMAVSAACGILDKKRETSWFGHRGRAFGTIYLIAENPDDFYIRLHAARRARNLPDDVKLPFVFIPGAQDLQSPNAKVDALITEFQGLDGEMQREFGVKAELFVVDTLARSMGGGNENASEVMTALVDNIERIARAIGMAGIGIHHGGKTAGKGPRGSEALLGACDLEIEVRKGDEGAPRAWTVRKNRSGKEGTENRFHLSEFEVGLDDQGDSVTSCVVKRHTDASGADEAPREQESTIKRWKDGRVVLPIKEGIAFKALADTIGSVGRKPPSTIQVPANTLAVTLTDWRDELCRLLFSDVDEGDEKLKLRVKQRRDRNCEKFILWGLVEKRGDWIWRTNTKVMNIDRPPARPKAQTLPDGLNPDDPLL